ncbi:sodium:solute symporter family protein [Halothermothrix orenii]|uniref:Sodium:solute symporter n=1 Tax=Halothermothrix orenii (strain H 168 / OCM 544 / DSM 9562) TaxID=373903 RepID=B8D066_HALOH|nr:sodium:solute symporter family protein [Halothermothrix orenii]ACL68820.1 Sodium:solute symporter [Halothermothrix orenii H 168]
MVLTTVIVYMLLLLAIGYWANRKIKGLTDYLLAGRRLGLWLTAGALAATHFGGGMVVGGGEYGFIHGFSGAWYGISCGIGLLFLSFLTAGKFRDLSLYTVPDYLAHRYGGKTVRVLGAILSVVAIIGIIAAQVLAAKSALAILGIKGNAGAIIATLIFIIYTVLGGLWAATITDFIQVIIAGVGTVIAASMVLSNTGGLSGLKESLSTVSPGVDYFNLFGFGWTTILWILLPTVMYTLIGQDFYQRLFASKDGITARKASFIGGIFLIIISFFPVITGMGARMYFPEMTDASMALPRLVQELFPLGLGAVFLAALLAAIMSTADSLLTAGTSHLIKDFWFEVFNRGQDRDKGQILTISRVTTGVLGLLALIIALLVPTVIDALIYSYTMYTAGVFIPLIGGVLWRGATRKGAISAIFAGSLVAITGILTGFEAWGIPVEVYSAVISLVFFVVISLADKKD